MAAVKTNFCSPEHGFRFINRFDFNFDFNLPFAGPIDLGNVVYGLCGGMCFAALDFYRAGKLVPALASVEEIEPSLKTYLIERQLDSLGLVVIPKVIEWMLRGDNDVASLTARYEIPKLRRSLDRGEPVVLALIRVQGVNNPTQNHQVIATGYDFDPLTKQMVIYLYDPNHPLGEPIITLDLTRPSSGIKPIESTGEPLRGFFVIRYRQQTPP